MSRITKNFEGMDIETIPHEKHTFLMDTQIVAKGFGVSTSTIHKHRQNHADEFEENKYIIRNFIPKNQRGRPPTYWTQRGIIRLGMFIRSERAVRFRDFAEMSSLRSLK